MKTVAIVSFNKIPDHDSSTVATVRLTKYLRERLATKGVKVVLIDTKDKCVVKKYDAVITVNGVFLYCNFREEYARLVELNDRHIWIGQDYNHGMWIPSVSGYDIKKRFYSGDATLIAAYQRKTANHKKIPKYKYLNWNQLTYYPNMPERKPTVQGLIYYGAYREHREPYFRKYFYNTPYRLNISAPTPKHAKKFAELNPKVNLVNLQNIPAEVGAFEAAIYIEDTYSHVGTPKGIYSSPANRFYEYQSGGVLTFFDRSVKGTFDLAGIDVSPWLVDSKQELAAKMADPKLRALQRELYLATDYRAKLDRDFDDVFGSVLGDLYGV
jgi:hypothetical protein